MSPFKERLLEFINHLGIGQTAFESATGLSRGAVNNISNALKQPSIDKIKATYPKLNTNWLITGQGVMIVDESQISPNIDLNYLIKTIGELSESNKILADSNKILAQTNREQWLVISSGGFGKASSPDQKKETNIYDAARGEEFQLSGNSEPPVIDQSKQEKKDKTLHKGS